MQLYDWNYGIPVAIPTSSDWRLMLLNSKLGTEAGVVTKSDPASPLNCDSFHFHTTLSS